MQEKSWKSVCCAPSPLVGVRPAEPGYVVVTPQNFSVYIIDVESCKKYAVWNIEEAISFTLPTTYCAFNKRYYAVANNTLILELAVENEVAHVKRRFTVQSRVAEVIGTARPIFVLENGVMHILVDDTLWTLSDRLIDEKGEPLTDVSRRILHVATFEMRISESDSDSTVERCVVLVDRDGTLHLGRLNETTNSMRFERIQLARRVDSHLTTQPGATLNCATRLDGEKAATNFYRLALFWSDQCAECVVLERDRQADRFVLQHRSRISLRSTPHQESDDVASIRECVALSGDWLAAVADSCHVHLVNLRIGLRADDARFRIALPERTSRADSGSEATVRINFDRTSSSLMCFTRNELFALHINNTLLRSALADFVSTSRCDATFRRQPAVLQVGQRKVSSQQGVDSLREAHIIEELLALLTSTSRDQTRLSKLITEKVTETVCVGELKRLNRVQLASLFDFLIDRLHFCTWTMQDAKHGGGTATVSETETKYDLECVIHWLTMLIDAQMAAFVTFTEFHRRLAETLTVVRDEVRFLDAASSIAALTEQVERLVAERRTKRRRVAAENSSGESYSVELISF